MKNGSKSLKFEVESCISEHGDEQINQTPLVELRLDYHTQFESILLLSSRSFLAMARFSFRSYAVPTQYT
jgi:hypothetical protein